jgi:hypothetical protein
VAVALAHAVVADLAFEVLGPEVLTVSRDAVVVERAVRDVAGVVGIAEVGEPDTLSHGSRG